ncbi:hypothetical protein F4553_003516 [Allocatelliglobosispora scoriae]|uniref:DUF4166 domain-containing protein n=1 Tax=Allocatelliglobosispora scoriae TaxID=643052 RepID=A0A841BM29_9ACTN|nr:DUF4166 domain-containing protein [Allocatelliglobosispora scoriae]MBB5870137.1 hypothetical protein [Allocatelliglobosispora scoriae]
MTSIFERALGPDFARLHPLLRRRFGFNSADGIACIGTGTMDRIWRGKAYTVPILHAGTARHILFPEQGDDVPFRIENYAYRDGFGRETVTFVRSFAFQSGITRRFDATMIYSAARGKVVDFIGTHQHVAVDLDLRVDDHGGLHITTGSQRICGALLGFPLPQAFSGSADVHEWWDERAERLRIEVTVANRRFGPIFGYRGSFLPEFVSTTDVPDRVRPLRETARE